MKTKSIDEYRLDVTTHLIRISGDLEHIKENVDSINKHLSQINGRVRETEKQISWKKGIGSTFVFIIGVILTWIGIDK